MKSMGRRIRGAITVGVTWGVAWLGVGLVLLAIVGLDAADVPFPLAFGMFGFLTGAAFSLIVGIVEGGRRFEQMSMGRFAGWGGAAGLLLAILFAGIVALNGEFTPLQNLHVLAPVFIIAGVVSATGTLALARSGGDRGLDRGKSGRRRPGDGV